MFYRLNKTVRQRQMQSYCREKMLTMGQTSLKSTSVIVHPQQVNHIIYYTNPKLRRHPHIQILVASLWVVQNECSSSSINDEETFIGLLSVSGLWFIFLLPSAH